MGIFDYLERLRNEPEHYRKRTAVIIAFSLTGVVFLGWLMSVSAGSYNVYTKEQNATTSPFAALGDAVRQGNDIIKNFKELISESRMLFVATSTHPEISEGDFGVQAVTTTK